MAGMKEMIQAQRRTAKQTREMRTYLFCREHYFNGQGEGGEEKL